MRLHRFYIQTPIAKDTFDISDRELIHQWRNVFRYNVGSQVILFDGSGTDYLCLITSLRNLGATVSVVQEIKSGTIHKRSVWLCMSLIKKDNFETIAEKATEIGVTHIVPVLSERTEKKNINKERLEKIILEASEQSGRGDIPMLHDVTTLTDLFESGLLPQDKIILDPTGTPFHQYVTNENLSSAAVFLGPEGGFSAKELELFKSYNVPVLSLGTPILRAETAAIAVSSLLLL